MGTLIIDFCIIIAMVLPLTVYTDEKEIILSCDIPISTDDLKFKLNWTRLHSPMLRNEQGLSVAIEGNLNPNSTSKTKDISKLVLKMKGNTLNDVYYCDNIFWEKANGNFEKVPQKDADTKYGRDFQQEHAKPSKDYLQIVREWVHNMPVRMYILLGITLVFYILSLIVIYYTSDRLFEVATVYAKIAIIMSDGGNKAEILNKLKKKYTKTRSP